MSKVDDYFKTYSGRQLRETYSLNTTGLWQIKGEDPNCDFGGNHYQPDLGIVEGKLSDVLDYAVNLPQFWTWGWGGELIFIGEARKIDPVTNQQRNELKAKEKALEKQLEAVRKLLKGESNGS